MSWPIRVITDSRCRAPNYRHARPGKAVPRLLPQASPDARRREPACDAGARHGGAGAPAGCACRRCGRPRLRAGAPAGRACRHAPATASRRRPLQPATGSQGFGVFVQGNAALGSTSTVGPVAMGGNLSVGSNFTVATRRGNVHGAGDSAPPACWSAAASTGPEATQADGQRWLQLRRQRRQHDRSVVPATGPTRRTSSLPGHLHSKPQVALATFQSPSLVSQSGLINFTSAFSTFASQSADMASCANSLVLTNSNGTALSLPLSANTNANVTLTPARRMSLISRPPTCQHQHLTFNNSPTRPCR